MRIRLASFRMVSIAISFGFVVCGLGVSAALAHGSTRDSSLADLTVVGPNVQNVEVGPKGHTTAPLKITISNSGTVPGLVTAARGFLDNPTPSHGCPSAQPEITAALRHTVQVRVPPHGSADAAIDLAVPAGCVGRSGTLEVITHSATEPLSLSIKIVRESVGVNYGIALVAGLAVSILTFIISVIRVRKKEPGASTCRWWKGWLSADSWGWWNRKIATGSSWTFKDSWLTNVSAIGAVLAATVAATGFLDQFLPGLPISGFVGLNLLFIGMLALGPVIYSAAAKWYEENGSPGNGKICVSYGTAKGLLLAAAVALWGIGGQLSAIVLLITAADAGYLPKGILDGLVGGAILVAAVYTMASTCGMIMTQDATSKNMAVSGTP